MSHNWRNYDKKLELSDAKITRKSNAMFSKQKSSKTLELKVDEQRENRPLSSNAVIDFVEQSKSRTLVSTSSAESQFTHVAESETWF